MTFFPLFCTPNGTNQGIFLLTGIVCSFFATRLGISYILNVGGYYYEAKIWAAQNNTFSVDKRKCFLCMHLRSVNG